MGGSGKTVSVHTKLDQLLTRVTMLRLWPIHRTFGESLDWPSPALRDKKAGLTSGLFRVCSLLLHSFLSCLS